jgi:uncharacterized LabA/DUF88 family protein
VKASDGESFSSIALFVDIENFVRSSSEIGLPVRLELIIQKLLETGRVIVRRAFGDLDGACRGNADDRRKVRLMMHESLLQYEDIPYLTRYKNTADMRLTVEALSVAYTYPAIEWFAIVASDRDYVPLIAKLRELGKRIIGVGCSPDTVNDIYVHSCDLFIYYSNLFPRVSERVQPDSAISTDAEMMDTYIRLFCDAVSSLEQRGAKAVGSAVAQLLRQMRPDFDLSLAGLRSFRALAEEAVKRNLCTTQRSGMDVLITLTSEACGAQPQPVGPHLVEIVTTSPSSDRLKEYFVAKLRCEWPDKHLRDRIYSTLEHSLREKGTGNAIALTALSGAVADELNSGSTAVAQPVVFKIVYSLFRARAFKSELSDEAYNPRILDAASTDVDWDEMFIRNSLAVLKRDKPTWQLAESEVSKFFGVDDAKAAAIMQALK